MNKHFIIGLVVVVIGSFGLFYYIDQQRAPQIATSTPSEDLQDPNTNRRKESQSNPPETQLDFSKQYSAVLKTEQGDITIGLNSDQTPITVNNFVSLARDDFYDDTIFHRVIEGFMIQGGDPNGDGTGGPGYTFDDEDFEGEYTRGTVAMANSGPNTNGSQFFIMHEDFELPKDYVIFGEVIEGIEVVDEIATSEVGPNYLGEESVPVNPVKIQDVVIIEE